MVDTPLNRSRTTPLGNKRSPGQPGTEANKDNGITFVFASVLVPLAVLEIYLAAQRSRQPSHKIAASALVLAMTALMAIGVFGTIRFMWGPYI